MPLKQKLTLLKRINLLTEQSTPCNQIQKNNFHPFKIDSGLTEHDPITMSSKEF
jgi:hypothetical protein